MGLNLEYSEGQTPFDEDEKEGLLIKTISTRSELDEFEQNNIEQAIAWTLRRSFKPNTILTEAFIKDVHKRMYGEVWRWAGEFRNTKKNIGVDKWQIPTELKYLLDDTRYWIDNQTFNPEEIAIMFKHRIVSIHCFANGNGRHSRLMADIIIDNIFGMPVFSWGATNLVKQGDVRTNYLKAVRLADGGEIGMLMQFARQ